MTTAAPAPAFVSSSVELSLHTLAVRYTGRDGIRRQFHLNPEGVEQAGIRDLVASAVEFLADRGVEVNGAWTLTGGRAIATGYAA